MSNLPLVLQPNVLPSLPDDILAQMSKEYDEAFADFGGARPRHIKVRKADFVLVDGGAEEIIPADKLVGVFCVSNKTNHAVWYERDYMPGQTPEAPDLMWIMPTMNTFPDALPEQYRKKINRNGRETWAFQILRRVVFILLRTDMNGQSYLDFDRPVVMDLSSMSLFGKSNPQANSYKWSGIRDLCSQCSVNGFRVLPSMFLTQIIGDPNVSVTGPVLFRPLRAPDGNIQFLDAANIQKIHEVGLSDAVQEMLRIREKLTYDAQPAPVQAAAQVAPAVANPPAAPTVPVAAPQPVMPQPVTPAAPVANKPDTNINSLLNQADAILNGTGAAPVTPEVQQPVAAPVMSAPATAADTAATTANIDAMLAQLNG